MDVERNIRQTQNVLALIEGSNPALQNEVVSLVLTTIMTAKLTARSGMEPTIMVRDRCLASNGRSLGGGVRHPAQAFFYAPGPEKKKVNLAAATSTSHPRFPLNRTVAMFQMDMIGRNEEHPANRSQQVPEEHASDNANALNVLGTAFSPDLRPSFPAINSRDQAHAEVSLRFCR